MVRSPQLVPIKERLSTCGVFSSKVAEKSWLLLLDSSLWTLTPLKMHGGKVGSGIHQCFWSWMVVNKLLWHCTRWCWDEAGTSATQWGWCLPAMSRCWCEAVPNGKPAWDMPPAIQGDPQRGGCLFLVVVPGTPCG